VLATDPARASEIYKSFVLAIQESKKSIHITCAYFVPDKEFVQALEAAAKRGVDVKLVLPGVSDRSLVYHAGHGFYEDLLEGGVKIYELQVAVLHAKTAVIDGTWATVDPAFGQDMESAFNEDLRDSKEITREAWSKRPWADRIKEWAARLAEYWI
jgi:cardiolipin synthase